MRRRRAARVKTRSATAGGMSRSCSSRFRRRSRTRSKSRASKRGLTSMSASSANAGVGRTFERGQADQRGVGADLGVELRAEPPERLVQLERVEIAAAFVEQIAGDGGEARTVRGIVDGARRGRGRGTDKSGTSLWLRPSRRRCRSPGAGVGSPGTRTAAPGRAVAGAIDRPASRHVQRGASRSSASSVRPRGNDAEQRPGRGRSQVAAAR